MKQLTPSHTNARRKIQVLVVDDHPITRTGLATLVNVEGDMMVVGEAGSGREAAEAFDQLRPDVTLMDLRMPGMDGVVATEVIRARHANARVIIISAYDWDEDIYRAFHAGAAGYLLKGVAGDEILEAIRSAYRGEVAIPHSIAQRLAQRTAQSELSQREFEVLRLMMYGLSNKEIGAMLFISERTVKLHASNLFAKIKVKDRTEAVMAALQRGLVHMEDNLRPPRPAQKLSHSAPARSEAFLDVRTPARILAPNVNRR
ncbi:MAG: DNA-binding response regulator [Verrucomicrobia bacterium]|nr:MAG: DNA-binding response regulator [Verrucomicrobiota bacterium]